MNKATDPILETLRRASGLYLTRGDINFNIQLRPGDQPSKQTVYNAFDDLERYGLVERKENGSPRFRVTELAKEYLDGGLDTSNLEPVD